jgi:hypothetical protein
VQGRLSKAAYANCPIDVKSGLKIVKSCVDGDPLSTFYSNLTQDPNIYNPMSADTIAIPGWSLGEMDPSSSGSQHHCGDSQVGSLLAVVDLYAPTSEQNPGLSYCHSLGMNIAHELGHTFGLTHTSDGTLMDGGGSLVPPCSVPGVPGATNNTKPCTLNANQVLYLVNETSFFARSTYVVGGSPGSNPPVITSSGGSTATHPGSSSYTAAYISSNGNSTQYTTPYGTYIVTNSPNNPPIVSTVGGTAAYTTPSGTYILASSPSNPPVITSTSPPPSGTYIVGGDPSNPPVITSTSPPPAPTGVVIVGGDPSNPPIIL